MFVQLRTRLLISNIVLSTIVIGLILFIIVELTSLSQAITRLTEIQRTALYARELSLYVQYSAHDTNSYALGHPEHRDKFTKRAADFSAIMSRLHDVISRGVIGDDERVQLLLLQQTRDLYDRASHDLFAAADANRTTPSTENRIKIDLAWEQTNQLEDQLDEESQKLTQLINNDVQKAQTEIEDRNSQMRLLAIGLGIVFVALIILAQVLAGRALGAPLVALLKGVKQFAAGGIETRVAVVRRDEIGELASAFNDMAATIERQRQNLVQLDVANAARAEAEAARAAITDQLATIEQQRSVIRDMSVPILPLTATTMVMPLVGALDSERIQLVQEQSLRTIQESSARWLILDVTGVPIIDSQVAQGLMQVVQATRLLGVEAVLVGIRPELAQAIVGLGLQLDSIVTRATLQSGVAYALQQ